MQQIDYKTGLEKYDTEGGLDIEASIDFIKEKMIERNPKKYKAFLKALDGIGILLKLMKVPNADKRVKLLKYSYYTLRLLDDIADDDTEKEFSKKEKLAIIDGEKGNGLFEVFKKKVLEIATSIGQQERLSAETHMDEIILSIRFDVERTLESKDLEIFKNGNERQKGHIIKQSMREREKLSENFFTMDTQGTSRGLALILGIDEQSLIKGVEKLSEATRIGYNIKDLQEDLQKLFINIPTEDINKYSINIDGIERAISGDYSGNIQKWINDEIKKMRKGVGAYNRDFSFFKIISDKGLKMSYDTSYLRRVVNNLIIRYVVAEVYKPGIRWAAIKNYKISR